VGATTSDLGAGDCERIRDGVIRQPSNTVSSAALIAVGAWIARRGRRRGTQPLSDAFGAAVAAAGAGSVLFHGPGGTRAHWLHDATIAAMAAFPPVENVRRLRQGSSRSAVAVHTAVTACAGALLLARPSWVQEISAALAAAGIATEVVARRARPAGAMRFQRSSDAVWLLALLAYVGGRTESPLCRPDSRVQLHGLWHALAGVAMATWAEAALGGLES
jgi:hypothetical protein